MLVLLAVVFFLRSSRQCNLVVILNVLTDPEPIRGHYNQCNHTVFLHLRGPHTVQLHLSGGVKVNNAAFALRSQDPTR